MLRLPEVIENLRSWSIGVLEYWGIKKRHQTLSQYATLQHCKIPKIKKLKAPQWIAFLWVLESYFFLPSIGELPQYTGRLIYVEISSCRPSRKEPCQT